MAKQQHSVQWLAQKLNCNRTNVYNIYNRASVGTGLLLQLSCILQRDFFALYSAQLRNQEQAQQD